ncbi:MAG: hypothetical protein MUC43_17350 [Pirellula sp.]|nr:hypothetical protein [Pirellula sp.]
MTFDETTATNSTLAPPKRWYESFSVDFVGVLMLFFLYAGSRVPEVNEVHYWTKAAHFWNPNFAAGDLFLGSGNAHWAFYFFFGSLTLWLPLETSVWVGRLFTWFAIALGWTALCHSIFFRSDSSRGDAGRSNSGDLNEKVPLPHQNPAKSPSNFHQPIPSTVLAALWLVGMEWGLWAGEWVVGGCESKGIAYAFLFGGLAALSKSKPMVGWSLLGLGNWFHVISGLWVSITAAIAIMLTELVWNRQTPKDLLRKHLFGLLLCGVGFAAGAAPAVLMDLDTPRDQSTLSAMEQVYNRLGHHLSPIKFSETRWSGFSILLIATFSLLLLTRHATWADLGDSRRSLAAYKHWIRTAPKSFQFLFVVCVAALTLSMCGLIFDLIFSHLAPKFASSILRFYWFRWNDVTLPLCASLLFYAVVTGQLSLNTHQALQTRKTLACIGLFLVVSLLVTRYQRNTELDIPAGEKQSFSLKTDSLETRLKQYEDWKAVCRWINENTDESGLWLTPRRQQSFKWQTRRPELAVWKDMPQNAQAVVEWSARLNEAYKFDKLKQLQPLSTEDLERLVNKYQIQYVLLDLRVNGQTIPKDKQIYPTSAESNDSFAVLQYEPATPAKSKASP